MPDEVTVKAAAERLLKVKLGASCESVYGGLEGGFAPAELMEADEITLSDAYLFGCQPDNEVDDSVADRLRRLGWKQIGNTFYSPDDGLFWCNVDGRLRVTKKEE